MPRTLTIDSYNKPTGDVTFTVAGSSVSALNQTYKVRDTPVSSKAECMDFARMYVRAYAAGILAARKADAAADLIAILGVPQNDSGEE